jgi:hypothetical protein
MSLFLTPNVVTQAKTASSTIASSDDLTVYTITAAAAATLPSTTGTYAGYVLANRAGGQGITVVQNAATSTANVTLTPASGDAIVGPSIVSPGQLAVLQSNGAGTWYVSVTSTGGGAQIQTNVIPITSANLLAIRTTPVTIVAAPSSGKCNIVDNISFKMVTTATQYASGGALEFRYTGTSGTKVTADVAAAVVTTTAGTSFTNVRGIEASLTGTVDAIVVVTAAAADFTTGTGTGVLTVQYHVV